MQFSTMTDGPGGGKGSRPYFVRKATGLEDVKVISILCELPIFEQRDLSVRALRICSRPSYSDVEKVWG